MCACWIVSEADSKRMNTYCTEAPFMELYRLLRYAARGFSMGGRKP